MSASDRVFKLGLTGGIACGKTTVAQKLAELGAIHLDADKISHELTSTGGGAIEPIRQAFGEGAILPDGSLDRRKMGEIVFQDISARRALEGIIHPMVQRVMLGLIDSAPADAVMLLDVPLLFETGMDAICDEVWCVTASRETQIQRIVERDGISAEDAALRVDAQLSNEEKAKRANAQINTDKQLERTLSEVALMYHALLRRIRG